MTGSLTLCGQGWRLVGGSCASQNRFQTSHRIGFTSLLRSGKAVRTFAKQVECGWEGSGGPSAQRLLLASGAGPRTAEIEMKASQTTMRPMSVTAEEPRDALGTASDPMMRRTSSAPRAPTPSKDTRTCNKLRPVNWLTREVT